MTDLKALTDSLGNLIGDVPVSEQICAAVEHLAQKEHTHDNYATREEVEKLKKKIELLCDLIGDIPVAEQISMAINKNK